MSPTVVIPARIRRAQSSHAPHSPHQRGRIIAGNRCKLQGRSCLWFIKPHNAKRPCAKGAGAVPANSTYSRELGKALGNGMRARRYPSDLSDCQWALVAPHIPPAAPGGRPRSTCMRAVLDALLQLLRTGCQWRQLPADFPPWPTVHGYFRRWRRSGVLSRLRRILHQQARVAAGHRPWPTLAIMDAQSAKNDRPRRCTRF